MTVVHWVVLVARAFAWVGVPLARVPPYSRWKIGHDRRSPDATPPGIFAISAIPKEVSFAPSFASFRSLNLFLEIAIYEELAAGRLKGGGCNIYDETR